jgi:hypothetical protein
MSWFDWLRRFAGRDNHRRSQWRQRWAEAVEAPSAAAAQDSRARLDALSSGAADDEEFEIEREMQEGLEVLVQTARELAEAGPPSIVTGHRAVGSERCHFSAPASLPDHPAQPSGTLLMTRTRLLFVGGGRAVTIPWHAISRCHRENRDIVLVRRDGRDLHRVRCNTFSDALRAAILVSYLATQRP